MSSERTAFHLPLRWLPALLWLAAAPMAIAAGPVQYRIDPVHTRVMFAVSHAGFSNAIGTVSGSTGTLLFDPDDWTGAKLEVSVPLERIDLGDADWNKAVLGRKLLDTRDHPVATFISTRIEPIDAQHASVFGTLDLRGVTKEIKLEVSLNQLKRHPMPPFRRTAGFSATTTLDRMDFGMDAWKAVIGDTIELRIEVEAVRDNGADGTDTDGTGKDGMDSDAQASQPPPPVPPEAEPEPEPIEPTP